MFLSLLESLYLPWQSQESNSLYREISIDYSNLVKLIWFLSCFIINEKEFCFVIFGRKFCFEIQITKNSVNHEALYYLKISATAESYTCLAFNLIKMLFKLIFLNNDWSGTSTDKIN
ncbi:hypothetical protein BpHYR1_026818 [Brachionus plicatilis]|uniref:Uncharacterized protein n=1 Tax=Brachionus plicatilis TaxID=10195 RepID=A0A3M7QD96_BRAPC|nr:hypothetical protein BpHYR1_026818 [Brachionus plicatilis]